MRPLLSHRAALFVSLATALAAASACSSGSSTPDDAGFPDGNGSSSSSSSGGGGDAGGGDAAGGGLSFATNIQPIIAGTCISCHTGTASGGLDLSGGSGAAYLALVGKGVPAGQACSTGLPATEKLVVPSNSGQSLLYNKVASAEPGGPMVLCGVSMPIGNPLPPAQVTTIKDWIDQGAKP